MTSRFIHLFSLIGFITISSCSQHWQGNPKLVSGTINHYASVISIKDCSNIEVSNASNFSPGDLILIIQIQGALIDSANTPAYGNITNYYNVGVYEYGRVEWASDDHIWLQNQLLNTYDHDKKIQIVSVPEYKNIKISGVLTCPNWDGNTGGIIAFRASGTVILESDINADHKGFKGGQAQEQSVVLRSYNEEYISTDTQKHSVKGEGLVQLRPGSGNLGRGAIANGGGGGGNHNAGGGGGSNGGSGGNGGYSYQHSRYSGNYQRAQGIGAMSLSQSSTRLFMGGGGGAGHSNNRTGSDGGAGGGIILIQAERIISNGNKISARGQKSFNAKYDGAGGAGAGGSIGLQVINVHGDLMLDASGGHGGGTDNDIERKNVGPGGGGGGGVIRSTFWSSNSGRVIALVNGGENGLTILNEGYGASSGGNGVIYNKLVLPQGVKPCIMIEDFKMQKKMQTQDIE